MATTLITCSLSSELDKEMRAKKLSPSECLRIGVNFKLGKMAEKPYLEELKEENEQMAKNIRILQGRLVQLESLYVKNTEIGGPNGR